jgi:hypothetical protein
MFETLTYFRYSILRPEKNFPYGRHKSYQVTLKTRNKIALKIIMIMIERHKKYIFSNSNIKDYIDVLEYVYNKIFSNHLIFSGQFDRLFRDLFREEASLWKEIPKKIYIMIQSNNNNKKKKKKIIVSRYPHDD